MVTTVEKYEKRKHRQGNAEQSYYENVFCHNKGRTQNEVVCEQSSARNI